jgi:hypothetical protein
MGEVLCIHHAATSVERSDFGVVAILADTNHRAALSGSVVALPRIGF